MNNSTNTHRYKRVMVIDDTAVDRYIAQHVIKKVAFA